MYISKYSLFWEDSYYILFHTTISPVAWVYFTNIHVICTHSQTQTTMCRPYKYLFCAGIDPAACSAENQLLSLVCLPCNLILPEYIFYYVYNKGVSRKQYIAADTMTLPSALASYLKKKQQNYQIINMASSFYEYVYTFHICSMIHSNDRYTTYPMRALSFLLRIILHI